MTDISEEFGVIPTLFQGSNIEIVYDLGDNDAESPNAEIDVEHIRNALALPLFFLQECEAEADLRQTYHSNEEGLFKVAQSILASTGHPVAWLTQKRKCSQELDDSQFRTLLERQQEQLLAEAKSEILRHEYKADLAENQIRELKRNWKLGILLKDMRSPDENKIYFMKKRQIENEHFHEMEELKRTHEFRVDEFSKSKLLENQDNINELMIKVQDLQNEIN